MARSDKGVLKRSFEERFFEKIEMIPIAGCWIWIAGTNGRDYGVISTVFKQPPKRAHRAAYEFFIGPIPEGLLLRHTCDISLCCNPHHMIPGTQAENMQDMADRGRMNPISLLNLRRGNGK